MHMHKATHRTLHTWQPSHITTKTKPNMRNFVDTLQKFATVYAQSKCTQLMGKPNMPKKGAEPPSTSPTHTPFVLGSRTKLNSPSMGTPLFFLQKRDWRLFPESQLSQSQAPSSPLCT